MEICDGFFDESESSFGCIDASEINRVLIVKSFFADSYGFMNIQEFCSGLL